MQTNLRSWVSNRLKFVIRPVLFFSLALSLSCSSHSQQPPAPVPPEILAQIQKTQCESYRDPNGHLHLRAESDIKGYVCWGYGHALDRAWMMDHFRRVTQGRTAELYGPDKVKRDFSMRLMGIYELALKIQSSLDAKTRERLWAYSWGVNQVFGSPEIRQLVSEFEELGITPEPWQPADSIALMLLQSFDQTRRTFTDEITESERLATFGESASQLFSDDGLPWDTSILQTGEYKTQTLNAKNQKQTPVALYQQSLSEFSPLIEDFGSNNWVVNSGASATGHAWMANDPHLDLKNPPFWHWVHIENPSFNVMGASFPGIPLITSGFNSYLAWGLTNAYLDSARISFVSQDEVVQTKTFRPTVWVRWAGIQWPIFFKSLERTVSNLPILPIEAPPGRIAVLNWTGFRINSDDIASTIALMYSRSSEEIFSSIGRVGIPSWNFVFSDTKGDIGYRTSGRVFKNAGQTPYGVSQIKLKELENLEVLPALEMPQLLKPKRNYIVTANNRQWPAGAQWNGGNSYRASFRAFRIQELIQAKGQHDLNSNKNIQCDLHSSEARFFVPLLIERTKKTTETAQALSLLEKWDFETGLECRACGVYRRWVNRVQDRLKLKEASLFRRLKDSNDQNLSVVLEEELKLALNDIKRDNEPFPKWGDLHKNAFAHLSDDPRFNQDALLPTPGDDNVVNPGTSDWSNGIFLHKSGGSQRLIVELTSPPQAYVQLAGSNQPQKPDFTSPDSDWNRWARCEYRPVQFKINWDQAQKVELN